MDIVINQGIAVLKVLTKAVNVEVDLSRLEEKALEIEYIAQQLNEMETIAKEKPDDIRYIG